MTNRILRNNIAIYASKQVLDCLGITYSMYNKIITVSKKDWYKIERYYVEAKALRVSEGLKYPVVFNSYD